MRENAVLRNQLTCPVEIIHFEVSSGPFEVRGGSVCLNSFGRLVKWISASIMPPPSSVPAR